jgi:hypothetical protein
MEKKSELQNLITFTIITVALGALEQIVHPLLALKISRKN